MNILMTTADHLMIDRRILQEAKTLIAEGHNVTLLAGFECVKRESYVLDGIKIERFCYDWMDSRFTRLAGKLGFQPGTKRYQIAWRIFRAWAYRISEVNCFEQYIVDRMMEYQSDVIHVHDYPMLAAGIVVSRMKDVPLIYDAHELYYAQMQLPVKIQRKYKKIESRLIKKVDAAITVNPYIADLMASRYTVKVPHVIMNAAPVRALSKDDLLRTRFNLPQTTRIVIYQGWISDNRGIDRVVEAARYFSSEIALVIVGYGDYESHLKKLVLDYDISDRVFFYGGVPSDSLHPLTCGADLGVIPYHGVDENNFFCSPNKLFEFAVAQVPFICNDLPFLRDVVQKYNNGMIADLNDPQAMAFAINHLFSDHERLSRMREGAGNASEELNWTVEGEKLLNIYKSLRIN